MHRYGRTSQDPSLSSGIPASDDSIFQLSSGRDEIEGKASTGYCDARGGHGTQGIAATIYVLSVIESKGRYSLRDNLNLCDSLVGEALTLSEHQEDGGGLWIRHISI